VRGVGAQPSARESSLSPATSMSQEAQGSSTSPCRHARKTTERDRGESAGFPPACFASLAEIRTLPRKLMAYTSFSGRLTAFVASRSTCIRRPSSKSWLQITRSCVHTLLQSYGASVVSLWTASHWPRLPKYYLDFARGWHGICNSDN
jgi:hypothetical protein